MTRPLTSIVIALATTWIGCSRSGDEPDANRNGATAVSSSRIVFLTREGCVNTPVMRRRLDAALKSLDPAGSYDMIDQGTLPYADARRGYPTPTILMDGADLFELPKPTPPFPSPG